MGDFNCISSGEIADSSPAISALSARKAANHSGSLDWKELAIVTKNSAAKQPPVQITIQGSLKGIRDSNNSSQLSHISQVIDQRQPARTVFFGGGKAPAAAPAAARSPPGPPPGLPPPSGSSRDRERGRRSRSSSYESSDRGGRRSSGDRWVSSWKSGFGGEFKNFS